MKNSTITWTHHTFNGWWGCQKVSPACDHCYAESWARLRARRLFGIDGALIWGRDTPRPMNSDRVWADPIAWNRSAARAGERHRVFCSAMSDVFEDRRDLDAARARIWDLIERTPNLDWLLLTKRAEAIGRLVPTSWTCDSWPHNVWLGATAEDQKRADERIPHLLEHGAAVRFVSCEPLRTPVDLSRYLVGPRRLDWVIGGGESGPKARPAPVAWFRSLRDQCLASGVPFHFKQWGLHTQLGNGHILIRLKSKEGRLLDGAVWDAYPTPGPVGASASDLAPNAWSMLMGGEGLPAPVLTPAPVNKALVSATGWDDPE